MNVCQSTQYLLLSVVVCVVALTAGTGGADVLMTDDYTGFMTTISENIVAIWLHVYTTHLLLQTAVPAAIFTFHLGVGIGRLFDVIPRYC